MNWYNLSSHSLIGLKMAYFEVKRINKIKIIRKGEIQLYSWESAIYGKG